MSRTSCRPRLVLENRSRPDSNSAASCCICSLAMLPPFLRSQILFSAPLVSALSPSSLSWEAASYLFDGEPTVDWQGDPGDVAARLPAQVNHRFANISGLDQLDRQQVFEGRVAFWVFGHVLRGGL